MNSSTTLWSVLVFERYLNRVRWVAILLSLITIIGCSAPPPNAETTRSITVLMWMPGESNNLDRRIAAEFTRKTGISVRFLPASESASRRLTQEMTLLRQQSSAVDVFQIDTIWPGMVADYLLDLKDVLADELPSELPEAIENATIGGRLVAAPFFVEYGMLYYRTDLLRKYGFSRPPRTWSELETQASRIQRGERAAGRPDFWGYVWQGADYEGLTCNALEWQSSQGGGNMLEQDHTVDVDNQPAVRAFARAARWVGTISPPGVTAYLEEDSRNVWQSGNAAFLRNWSYVYSLASRSPEVGKRFAVAPMPAGVDPHSSALGGEYLGISKYTRHRPEAVAFVKYLTGREVEREAATGGGFLPTFPSLYRDPAVVSTNPFFASIADVPNRVVRRPAALVGSKYDRVSLTYAHGIHAILTGQVSASEGAAKIQAELVHITGFPNSDPVLRATGTKPPFSASRTVQHRREHP